MKDKRKKSMDEIETSAALIVLLVLLGLAAFNFLVFMIPNEIVKFSILGLEILIFVIGGYLLIRTLDDVTDSMY